MSDIMCRRCGEPWEVSYLRHEGLWDHPGTHAPQRLQRAHDELRDEDDRRYYAAGGGDYERVRHPDVLYRAVASGEGCPSCWSDPSRVATGDEAEKVYEAALWSLVDGTDDDPLEFM